MASPAGWLGPPVYEHSPGLAFVLLFLLSWIGHALGGFAAYAADEVLHHHDHRLLNIHHVRDMPFDVPPYDWIFLAVGGVSFSLIWLLLGGGNRELPPTRA